MNTSLIDDKHFLKYLGLLGIQKQKPCYKYLCDIMSAQLSKIPFENISKLYYRRQYNLEQLIDFELYLKGIENYSFGGTCYSINYYLNQLLSWLGFDVKLCGASMKNPDVHLVNVVQLNNRKFLVDAGYAAPFLEPIPLDLADDYIITWGNDQYVLKTQTENHLSKLELYRNNELRHGYTLNPIPKDIHEFENVIKESFKDDSIFMNALLLVRLEKGKLIVVSNMTYSESTNNMIKKYPMHSVNQLVSTINNYFDIPKPIIFESLYELPMSKDGWE